MGRCFSSSHNSATAAPTFPGAAVPHSPHSNGPGGHTTKHTRRGTTSLGGNSTMPASGPQVHAVQQNRDEIRIHTKEEAAEILRVKVSWLERRAAARQIPFTMLGGAYRFTDAHLAEIVRLNERGALVTPVAPATGRRPRRRTARPAAHTGGFMPLRPRPAARKTT